MLGVWGRPFASLPVCFAERVLTLVCLHCISREMDLLPLSRMLILSPFIRCECCIYRPEAYIIFDRWRRDTWRVPEVKFGMTSGTARCPSIAGICSYRRRKQDLVEPGESHDFCSNQLLPYAHVSKRFVCDLVVPLQQTNKRRLPLLPRCIRHNRSLLPLPATWTLNNVNVYIL